MAPKTKTKTKNNVKIVVSSPYMEEYWELSRQMKVIKDRIDELKPEVTKFLIEESHPLYTFSQAKRSVKIDPFKIYDWIKDNKPDIPPERLEELATHSLAPEALDLLFLDKYISEEEIPPECYETSGGHYIIRPKDKK